MAYLGKLLGLGPSLVENWFFAIYGFGGYIIEIFTRIKISVHKKMLQILIQQFFGTMDTKCVKIDLM